MFDICQVVIQNRYESPGAAGESSTNISMFSAFLCSVLFVINVGEIIPACMCYRIE